MNGLFGESVARIVPRIFEQMVQIVPKLSTRDGNAKEPLDITSIIGIKSADFAGFVSINFDKKVATTIAGSLLGMKIDELTDDVKDAVGEICNVVAGNMKTDLNGLGVKFDITVPMVVTGDHVAIHAMRQMELADYFFELPEGRMTVEVGLQKVSA